VSASKQSEVASGILLIAAAAAAMWVANGPWAEQYHASLHHYLGPLSLLHWINDGLMAVFFLFVGLEVKRELVSGQLARPADRALPVIVAAGGAIVPALVFLAIVAQFPHLVRGWAIASATDIAFVLAIVAMLGTRAPASLKLFLTTVAIIDDMFAVAIIAVAFMSAVKWLALAAAAGLILAMFALNRAGVQRLRYYLPIAGLLWAAVLVSGIHATLAGVVAAAMIPMTPAPGSADPESSALHRLEHALQPWVAFLIVPVFGFANAGVSLPALGAGAWPSLLTIAVAVGLFAGKQTGIGLSLWLGTRFGIGQRPAGTNWVQIYGASLLCGVGFTMSLFIGGLAFHDPALVDEVKLGVLAGSLLSGIGGYLVLRFARPPRPRVAR